MSQEHNPEAPDATVKEPRQVAAMFDRVAAGYDRTNTVMVAGQDRGWRRATRAALELGPGQRCLDLGAGTGVSTAELAKSGADVVGVDMSLGMMAEHGDRDVNLVAANALNLPFGDGTFDAVTGSFFIRNVSDVDACLVEARRVLKPGGRLVLCEITHPTWQPFRFAHGLFVKHFLPRVAGAVGSDKEAYTYLSETIDEWPEAADFADQIVRAGFKQVAWRNLSGGAVALHRGYK
ncbi:class I SAM-dependent methyltransferase [Natronoglycomyces albus]|uniref:Demethylmenaquinone methyltransferase n=1 Tax=Natronoglycomyces albus TaxID=2811108 RepID=A0A895XQ43_9ACTN|nr:class I SAM-dependent methyltransferase [Natronoglycomyces albus]QSB05842.1 class I SAM-dependent methyltransferase [Natronoglycomyces albus]